jgi:hypothetical protein
MAMHWPTKATNKNTGVTSSIADVGCLPRIQIFPSQIPGQKGNGLATKNLSTFREKIVTKLLEIDRECLFWIRIFLHSGSRIQGLKKHRIPDPNPYHWSIDPDPTSDLNFIT